MNTVKVENCKTLFIGRRGENEVTEVVFDFTAWQEQFGAGVIDLYVKRNLDVDAYPVVLSVDGTVATWLVTAADTDVVGNGKIEFVYTVNEKVAKSAVFPFFVGEDIGESSPEPPEHYQSWLEQLTELGAETQANAQAAAQSASDAAESVASAEANALAASTSASEASDSAESADANAQLAIQSAESADSDAKSAAQSASDAADSSASAESNARAASQSASDAADSSASAEANAQAAAQSESNAEAWAVGERGGDPVSAGDPTYENNAKYWAENARDAALVKSVNGKTGVVELDLDDIPNGETFTRATPAQLAQISKNADDIADIDEMIPNTTSESNPLVNVSFLTNRLTSYRTSAAQDTIDAGKQDKITAYGLLKRDRSGNISAAVAGADYVSAEAFNVMRPAATAADIGKALIVKAVENGKPSAYEYGEAGGGGSAPTAGDGINITNDVISNTQGIEYIVGTQTAATAKWTGVSTDETLKVGKIIAYYLPYAGASTAATLALTMADGTTTREISLQLKPGFSVTTNFPAGSIIILVYDGTYWRVNASYDTDTNTYTTGYCVTNGAVAAKTASCTFGYRGDTNYFPCLFRFANTATDATLAITTYAPEAAPIYVNGQRTSATNTFSAGVILFLYYNGAYYCYNDGRFPILVDGTVTSVQEYAAGLLADYRTAADQDTIDAGKQAKITATGILKGDGSGGVSSAVAGTDYITGLEILSYGNSTWDDFLTAYTAKKVVYCRASSNTNPASGDQTRLAFMAYVNNADNPTNVEFQYYRSIQTHSDSQQGDQAIVYKLDKTAGWTVTTRNTFTAIDAGTGLSKAYSNGKLTLGVNSDYRTAADQDTIDSEQDERIDGLEQTTTATTIGPVALATFEASAADMPLKGLTANIGPVQSGSGDPSPDNVRPITGLTGCKLHCTGVSLIGGDAFIGNTFSKTANGYQLSYNGSSIGNRASGYADISGIPEGRYVLQFLNCSYPDGIEVTFRRRTNGTLTTVGTIIGSSTSGVRAFDIPANTTELQFYIIPNSTVTIGDKVTMDDAILYRNGETAEPYKGNTYNITFPTEAGTVYGGTLDVVNRKLNSYPYYSSYNGETIIGPWISSMDVYTPDATPTLGAQVVDMGGAATSYDLFDVPEITTLLGENNIWANRGDVIVTYGAYLEAVKSYADKVGDSILSAIAPLETSYTASRSYAAGSFLFVGTKFYKVTASISSGDTITPDTNVTQTTVAEQLMALANV